MSASRFIHLANGHAAWSAAVVPTGEADAPPSSAATPSPAGIPSLPAGPGRPFLPDWAWVCVGCIAALLADVSMVAWVVVA